MRKNLLFFILMALALAACGVGSIRDQGVTEATIILAEYSLSPDELIVPSGEEITLHLANHGAQEHDLTIMVKPAEAPFDAQDQENVWWQASLPGGEQATLSFTAPAAPGEYQLLSAKPGDLEANMVGKLIVVQP